MKLSVQTIVKVSLLSAIAFILMLIEFPIPVFPMFLKLDLSEIPVLLAAFALGPFSAVLVELIKNVLHLFRTSTAGIGEMANFFVGICFVIPAGLLYKRNKSRKGALMALMAASLSMVVFASLFNYLVLLPLYAKFLHFPTEAVVKLGTQVNSAITDVKTLIALGIAPFNALKAIVVSGVTLAIYKKLSPILHR